MTSLKSQRMKNFEALRRLFLCKSEMSKILTNVVWTLLHRWWKVILKRDFRLTVQAKRRKINHQLLVKSPKFGHFQAIRVPKNPSVPIKKNRSLLIYFRLLTEETVGSFPFTFIGEFLFGKWSFYTSSTAYRKQKSLLNFMQDAHSVPCNRDYLTSPISLSFEIPIDWVTYVFKVDLSTFTTIPTWQQHKAVWRNSFGQSPVMCWNFSISTPNFWATRTRPN